MNNRTIRARYRGIDVNFGSTGLNVYTCEQGHNTKTAHREDLPGVTPMFIQCPVCARHLPKAYHLTTHLRAVSHNYRVAAHPDKLRHMVDRNGGTLKIHASGEWFRPSLQACLRLRKTAPALLDHILDGGLVLTIHEKSIKL
jgi:hypothetical protein